MDIQIKPLSPERTEDFISFFESVAFCDHPYWSACYCYSFHFTGPAEQWTKENNLAAVRKLIGEGRMKGYLAYRDRKAVGWCNANNRLGYQRLVSQYDLEGPAHEKTCSIVCFVIHQETRRSGIAHQILQKIIADYEALGYGMIEAYPAKGDQTDEGNYKGPLALYMNSGFEIVKELDSSFLVRKSLQT
jgi:ribosomal protein S18 acetylase RimI-like enzyme